MGRLTEILLKPGEVFTHLNASAGWVISKLVFISDLQTYPAAGQNVTEYTDSVPLNGLLYFSGAAKDHYGVRVSQLAAHRERCGEVIYWSLSVLWRATKAQMVWRHRKMLKPLKQILEYSRNKKPIWQHQRQHGNYQVTCSSFSVDFL